MLTAYEESLKNFWDLNNCLDTAERKGKEEGIAIGKEEGIAIGKEEGIAIGKEQGLAEGLEKGEVIGAYKEKIENVRKLKALGVAMDVICKASGLSEEEIEKL